MANLPIIYNRKDGLIMEIKVRVFLDGKQIESSELHKLTIKNAYIDKVINDVIDRNSEESCEVADVQVAS